MKILKNLVYSITVSANCLLAFLLVFYDRLAIPSSLQVIGRMHPLFLHFPIVVMILAIGWIMLGRKNQLIPQQVSEEIGKSLLLFAAFTSVLTALMGLFLSRENGYGQDSLQWHKWSGVFVCWISLAWYIFYAPLNNIKFSVIFSIISFGLILFTGHEGAQITHGDNFLLAPITPEQKLIRASFDEALVFKDMVKPILDAKCMGCHNSSKAKGDLIMETQQSLLKGGKDGPLWDSTKPDLGMLFERIHLSLEQKKHMPPSSKEQLTDQEMVILYRWVKDGADFKLKVKDIPQTDTLRSIAESVFKSDADEVYDFEGTDDKTVDRLKSNYRAVYRIAKESPALGVDFYGASFFKTDQLTALDAVKKQIVSLNLEKMPVTDEDLKTISQFTNLRSLNLAFTNIKGQGLSYLSGLTHLRSLSLSNTAVKSTDITKLAPLKTLHHLYLWNTSVSAPDLKSMNATNPDLAIEFGINTDTILTKLNAPILQNENAIIDTPILLSLKHYVPGITIHYTLDGSEPDSLSSPVYGSNVQLSKQVMVKAKAFKKGWLASDVLENQFYHGNFKSDTVLLMTPADSLYPGKGSRTLYNLEKGDINSLRSGKWLGFRKNPMECLLVFTKPILASEMIISSDVDRNALVFPPQSIQLWGGEDLKNLKLLTHLSPAQPDSSLPGVATLFYCKFKPLSVRFLKLQVTPVPKLPKKLQSKQNKTGWFFVDELFVN